MIHPQNHTTKKVSRTFVAFLSTLAVTAGMLSSANAAQVDPRVVAVKTTANTTNTPDIEDIVLIGINVGSQMGTNQSGQIKLTSTNAGALTKYLATELINRQNLSAGASPERTANVSDEIGEVAAFVFDSIAAGAKFRSPSSRTLAKSVTFAILKNALLTAKNKPPLVGAGVIRDVVTSVSLTLHNDTLIPAGFENQLKKYLFKKAAKIAGTKNKSGVKSALRAGFAGSVATNLAFEDGNIPTLAQVNDPETDQRNG